MYEHGMESIGHENYYIDIDRRAKDAYLKGDMDYIESVFKDLEKETKKNLVSLALRDGKEYFVKKHNKELKGVQRKYLEAKESKVKITEETGKIKEDLIRLYKDNKFVDLEIDIMKVDTRLRSDVIEEIYKSGNLEFVVKYLDAITTRLKNEILISEYKKGNINFVYKNFGKIDDGDLKNTILQKELKDKNLKFLYENYEYIYNQDVKEKILKYAYKEENVEFLNKHLADMPKNMKLEAAIRFKDLKISKIELAELLKK